MDTWTLILYGAAFFLTIKTLVTLMASHKRHYSKQLIAQKAAQHRAELKRKKRQQAQADVEESSPNAA